MTTEKTNKKNGNLSLYPLKFEEAVSEILKVKPEPKKDSKTRKDKVYT